MLDIMMHYKYIANHQFQFRVDLFRQLNKSISIRRTPVGGEISKQVITLHKRESLQECVDSTLESPTRNL